MLILYMAFGELSVQDAELLEQQIAAIAGGDMAALAALYENTKAAVYGFALSITRNPHDAEDILQTVYIQLHKNAGQYQSQGKPMAWILTMTKNLAKMQLRKDGRVIPLSDDFEAADTKNPLQTGEDRLLL